MACAACCVYSAQAHKACHLCYCFVFRPDTCFESFARQRGSAFCSLLAQSHSAEAATVPGLQRWTWALGWYCWGEPCCHRSSARSMLSLPNHFLQLSFGACPFGPSLRRLHQISEYTHSMRRLLPTNLGRLFDVFATAWDWVHVFGKLSGWSMCRCQSAMAQSIETAAGVGRSCLVCRSESFWSCWGSYLLRHNYPVASAAALNLSLRMTLGNPSLSHFVSPHHGMWHVTEEQGSYQPFLCSKSSNHKEFDIVVLALYGFLRRWNSLIVARKNKTCACDGCSLLLAHVSCMYIPHVCAFI